jgi:uncharacterized protein (DUF1015 family)
MASIRPFAAYRYDLARVHAQDVVTQPYDKISAAMRQRYLAASPYNLVRIILGEPQADDNGDHNVYTRAAGYLTDWMEAGILRPDSEPGVYPYSQTFTVPEQPGVATRRGFIALGRLEPYSNRVVFRHEQTLSGPKLDRQALLRATRTHFGQIFMLYSDPARQVEEELLERARNPIGEVHDEYGTEHRLYRETDAGVLARLQRRMAPLPLIIADGHHRYETALQWMQEQDSRASHRPDQPWHWVMMTFVNLDAPGLVVLPTHRLVHGLTGWSAASAREKLGAYFTCEDAGAAGDAGAWPRLRARLGQGAAPAFAAALQGDARLWVLRPRPELAPASLLPGISPRLHNLDVVLLHELALGRALGVTPEMVKAEQHLRYVKDGAEALASAAAGAAQAVFLLNPLSPAQVRDVALAGEVLPQKSTDFFPKLLSGLTMYRAG